MVNKKVKEKLKKGMKKKTGSGKKLEPEKLELGKIGKKIILDFLGEGVHHPQGNIPCVTHWAM